MTVITHEQLLQKKAEEIAGKVSLDIASLVERLVSQRLPEEAEYKQDWDWLKSELNTFIDQAQQQYEYVKADGLTANMVEAEGYLRGLKAAMDYLLYIEGIRENKNFAKENPYGDFS